MKPAPGSGSPNVATPPVGSFLEGASPFGVLDLTGNVDEWTETLYAPYPDATADVAPIEDWAAEGTLYGVRGLCRQITMPNLCVGVVGSEAVWQPHRRAVFQRVSAVFPGRDEGLAVR